MGNVISLDNGEKVEPPYLSITMVQGKKDTLVIIINMVYFATATNTALPLYARVRMNGSIKQFS